MKLSCVVMQVYEQLYDTLEIVGGPEVRAQATAKVTAVIAASSTRKTFKMDISHSP